MEYKTHSNNLTSVLTHTFQENSFTNEIRSKIHSDRYLVKGDLSGIQDYIFSIPSKGAARKLKARSRYVEEKTKAIAKRIKSMYNNYIELYMGGGNFYLFCEIKDPQVMQTIERELNEDNYEPYSIISWIEVSDDDLVNFEKTRESLEAVCSQAKLQKFKNNPEKFIAFDQAKSVNPGGNENLAGLPIWSNELIEQFKGYSQEKIENHNTIKSGDIIQFEHLASMAGIRTGTSRLGVLKLDVDDLGLLFNSLTNLDANRAVSQALEYFFGQYLFKLLDTPFEAREMVGFKTTYKDNLYIVFSGGDDAFIVGAWDAVTEFCLLLAEKFIIYTGYDGMAKEDHKLTFSASLLTVDSHFPVKRFADKAEEMLHEAKYNIPGEKGRINFMGNVFTWDQFNEIKKLTDTFHKLIVDRKESRAFISKLQQLSLDYEVDSRKSAEMRSIPKVWRLNYIFRNIKENNKEYIIQNIIKPYEMEMLKFNLEKTRAQSNIYYAAARWTELLTRNLK